MSVAGGIFARGIRIPVPAPDRWAFGRARERQQESGTTSGGASQSRRSGTSRHHDDHRDCPRSVSACGAAVGPTWGSQSAGRHEPYSQHGGSGHPARSADPRQFTPGEQSWPRRSPLDECDVHDVSVKTGKLHLVGRSVTGRAIAGRAIQTTQAATRPHRRHLGLYHLVTADWEKEPGFRPGKRDNHAEPSLCQPTPWSRSSASWPPSPPWERSAPSRRRPTRAIPTPPRLPGPPPDRPRRSSTPFPARTSLPRGSPSTATRTT